VIYESKQQKGQWRADNLNEYCRPNRPAVQ